MAFFSQRAAPIRLGRHLSPRMAVVLLGLSADTLIALLKFAAARESGGAALFTEGVHSLLDVLTEVILLYGLAAARRPADRNFQMGYGRSAFFWNLIAAMLILALGAGYAFREGWHQYADPQPLGPSTTSFVVLLLSFLIDGGFAYLTYRKILTSSSSHNLFEYLRRSRDGTTLTVLFTSFASLAGIVIAALGTLASIRFDFPAADGVASLAIALMMAGTALLLANESRSLLIGTAASPEVERSILEAVATVPGVSAANGMISVRVGPERLVISISIAFQPDLRTSDIETAVAAMESLVRRRVPQVSLLLVKPQSEAQFRELQAKRGW
jgi:cation diffusion facilitator family transporter